MAKVISIEKIFQGKLLSVYKKIVENEDKSNWERETVGYGGAASAVVAEYNNAIILVSQFRPTAQKYFLELPAGRIEEGESPFDCAKRELEEETGLVAHNLRKIARFYPSP
ncbi:MAG: NUDIX hydrolase, partial [Caldisericaceae bacterium]